MLKRQMYGRAGFALLRKTCPADLTEVTLRHPVTEILTARR